LVSKDGEQGGSSSGAHAEHDEEEQDVAKGVNVNAQDGDQPVVDTGAGTSVGNQGNRILSMSPFERFMVNRLDNFAKNQRNLHDFCATNFQNIDDKFQSMDTRFYNLD